MSYSLTPILFATAFLVSGCSEGEVTLERSSETKVGTAQISMSNGQKIGLANVEQKQQALVINVHVEGLSPGELAFHLHESGECDGPDFASAGGHLNPFSRTHGVESSGGAHLGDMPNLVVSEGGTAELSYTFSGDAEELIGQIFDADGTAVMIHAGPDDYASDPAGAAGPRIACGVLVAEM